MWYLLPGLGADERVFRHLRLPGPSQVLDWLPPTSPTEPLAHYAARPPGRSRAGRSPVLAGGRVFWWAAGAGNRPAPAPGAGSAHFLSSLGSPHELSSLLRLAGATGLHRLLPFGALRWLPRLAQWFFGARGGAEYRLLRQILRDTNLAFARWATAQLLAWRGPGLAGAVRLHGTRDRLLPPGPARIDYPVPGAGHFLIVSHAAEISRILRTLG